MPTKTTATNFTARFWAKVDQHGPVADHMTTACWVWIGAHDTAKGQKMSGYGLCWRGSKYEKAHRVAWEISFGRRPVGIVRHQCDNPRCVRVDHLLEGSHADNAADKVGRNRQQRLKGEAHGRALLSDESVRLMRAEYRHRKIPLRKFAARFGVGISTVHAAITGLNWPHIEARHA